MKTITIALTALSLFIFASCKQEQTKIHKNPTPVAEVKLDSALFNTQLEKGISVSEARKLKSGDEVTVSGKILGARSVFVDGRASFIIGNPDVLISCDLKPGDNCPIPWDVCCEGKETIASNTVSIQVVDESGKVLKTGLKGKNGLKELALVTIKGTVAPQSSEATTIINASAIQVN